MNKGEQMSYKKDKESMLSFILPIELKDELQEYCVFAKKSQSQVLREAINQYVLFARHQFMEKQVG